VSLSVLGCSSCSVSLQQFCAPRDGRVGNAPLLPVGTEGRTRLLRSVFPGFWGTRLRGDRGTAPAQRVGRRVASGTSIWQGELCASWCKCFLKAFWFE